MSDPQPAGMPVQMAAAGMAAQMAPAAGSGGAPLQPTAAVAGSGGSAGDLAGAAGSAGAESDNLRQRLIDSAIEALGGGSADGGEPWRNGGRDGGRLSADLVTSVLFSMRTSGVCFRDVRRCVETCVVISQDCKPCAEDPECAAALKEVCGETLGTCRMP